MSIPSNRFIKLVLVAGVVLSLAACASQPAPAPVAPTPPPPPPAAPRAPTPPPPAPPEQPTGPVPGSIPDFVINAGDRVYFDYDKYAIRADASPVLDRQAEWLRRYPQIKVRIEGNCDERGTREYNLALGARRADAVRSYLVARGVADSRISVVSYGKERPIDPGEGEAAWARNRNGHTALTEGAR